MIKSEEINEPNLKKMEMENVSKIRKTIKTIRWKRFERVVIKTCERKKNEKNRDGC